MLLALEYSKCSCAPGSIQACKLAACLAELCLNHLPVLVAPTYPPPALIARLLSSLACLYSEPHSAGGPHLSVGVKLPPRAQFSQPHILERCGQASMQQCARHLHPVRCTTL